MKKSDNIQLASTDQCTGCSACASICPTKSINMIEDKEGFLQPHIDTKTCIGCHKCEKNCPIITPIKIPTDFETQAYAAINKDEAVRMRSSSGGMFHALAKWTIGQGGVVFGARFNDQWEVVHDYTESIEGIEPFMRSKYVQSRIGDTFKQAKHFLDAGRQVLFVGTPCQIGGLKSYLRKDYPNLLSVDIICHGVPSPKVWRTYIKETAKNESISDVNFRDKRDGWKGSLRLSIITNSFVYSEKETANLFYKGFLGNVFLRRSCYNCPFKSEHRITDITIADAWGIEYYCPDMDDTKGTSLLVVHSSRALKVLKEIPLKDCVKVDLKRAIDYNIFMTESVNKPAYKRRCFFQSINLSSFRIASYYIDRDPVIIRVFRKIKRKLRLS